MSEHFERAVSEAAATLENRLGTIPGVGPAMRDAIGAARPHLIAEVVEALRERDAHFAGLGYGSAAAFIELKFLSEGGR